MRHVWGAASREVPPAHPNHNLDGFRVLLKTLRGFVFILRPTCLWRARPPCNNSAGFAPLEALAQPLLESSSGRLPLEAAPSTSFTSFGELFRLRLPAETLLNLLKLWLLLEALAQPPSKKLLRLLPLEALAQPPSDSSLNLLALNLLRRFSTSFDASQPPQALAAAGGALAQLAVSCRWRRSLNLLWRALQAAAGDASQPP